MRVQCFSIPWTRAKFYCPNRNNTISK